MESYAALAAAPHAELVQFLHKLTLTPILDFYKYCLYGAKWLCGLFGTNTPQSNARFARNRNEQFCIIYQQMHGIIWLPIISVLSNRNGCDCPCTVQGASQRGHSLLRKRIPPLTLPPAGGISFAPVRTRGSLSLKKKISLLTISIFDSML